MLPSIFSKENYLKRFNDMFDRNYEWKLDSYFENFFSDFDSIFGDVKYIDSENNLVYEIEVPGFNKDNLKVEIENNILTVKGERNLDEKSSYAGKKSIHKRVSISKSEDVEAEIKDGILYLKLKRPEEKKVNVKEIEIK